MFQDITQNDAVLSIKALIREDNLRKTDYAVWWKGKLISPSAVISKHYEIVANPINRDSFDTNQAQKALLNLGFPIVDTTRADNFFTEKELKSFQILIARKDYNSLNPVDRNIGDFLRDTVWSKTQLWAEKLEELGWKIVSKRRGWNTRHQKSGFQTYKQYAWCSLKPYDGNNSLLFFTVGVDENGDLDYKMDIQWSDKTITQSQKDLFFKLREQANASFHYVKKEDVEKYSWKSLVKETDAFYSKHLDTYSEIYYLLWPEKRLMRIVWNDNNWQVPMERYWNQKWQGRKNKAHHQQYGFGFEEWLFNNRYLIDSYRYGYIRGVASMPVNASFINELYLYSIHPSTKQNFLIGKLSNVEVYHDIDDVEEEVVTVFENSRDLMLRELEEVEADTKLMKTLELRPNLAFHVDDAVIYQEPILLDEDAIKIHRFIPRVIDDDLETLVEIVDAEIKDPKMKFETGNGTGSNSYAQNVSGGKRNVNRTHADITNDLHAYLTQSKEYKGFEISTEKTRICNNLVDCAAKHKDKYILFEVKTANSVLACIRQALGQIIEYALLDTSLEFKQLIIIGPATPTEFDLTYFQNLKDKLKLPLKYWSYSSEEKTLNKKFKNH
ncbi:hypothetical protein G5B37_04260 [Rasiella rasia]|uniref:Uncharacterized protein n=1 Tax=Rasiella rasia TaxID=2744027 RepID=A0A6G6GM80_9FLAO|nr:hypothetical protein [Rasiella rasia]QIE58801.1 hypothetical protein G5B37_04260 [Rasiella rasia]